MQKALNLAKKAQGNTSPNPLVGAILVKNNKILATGYHKKAGTDHAEIIALKKAGTQAKGSSLYINLEPCCHFGKTPPCSRALIDAEIKEVHIATLDPNPLVSGKGKTELEKAGIKVFVGEKQQEAQELNEIFFKYINSKMPFVIAKWGMSLDGKIATHTGESKWITNETARLEGRKLRTVCDAILVGVNTILTDDPELTARVEKKPPMKRTTVVVDSSGKTPLTAKIFKTINDVIIATTEKMSEKKQVAYTKLGATILKTKSKNGQVDLKSVLTQLGKMHITSVLIEGGGETIASAIEENLVDKVHIFIGDKIIGGIDARSPVGGLGFAKMKDVSLWNIETFKKINGNIEIIAYPNYGKSKS
ncbi:MAG: bifunctional diaminohydroxyphosphoribosylaminopyrimidine deaminase/5-amino-6-(5-phosphoribosylamino)uracil reductase RibD [Candidatus Magasanikbacteria bacterium]|nr:bifunctional diaminohydroxyphosphoribosylaminopyrimidine deaminase/5-amino-6-(5-phosphoribosylamino)uracil reductase RibD [Candidatus Magasanikbacteria bacterium]